MPIVFETQEEFEEAVMAVLRNRLGISVYKHRDWDSTNLEVCIYDNSPEGRVGICDDDCRID
jgi:hypothetical protein